MNERMNTLVQYDQISDAGPLCELGDSTQPKCLERSDETDSFSERMKTELILGGQRTVIGAPLV